MSTRMERRLERKRLWRRDALHFMIGGAILLAVIVLLRTYAFGLITVQGDSMMNTLSAGQVVAVDKTFFRLHEPKAGVIVICKYPDSGDKYVKRVIALPGDEVEIRDGIAYVNGVPREEEYVDYRDHGDFGPYVVEENCVFVMGDNRANSHDSRAEGAIPQDLLVGRVFAVFFPAKDAHFLPVT